MDVAFCHSGRWHCVAGAYVNRPRRKFAVPQNSRILCVALHDGHPGKGRSTASRQWACRREICEGDITEDRQVGLTWAEGEIDKAYGQEMLEITGRVDGDVTT